MANPYTSGAGVPTDQLDPFADPGARSRAAAPAPSVSAAAAAPPKPPAPGMEFYNPTPAEASPERQQAYVPPPAATAAHGGGSAPPLQPPREHEAMPPARELKTSRFWTLEFYQQFFDVDTKDVLLRMSNAMVPINPPDFLVDRKWHFNDLATSGGGLGGEQTVDYGVSVEPTAQQQQQAKAEKRPDIYGPFWICTTLWMALAIVGNIMSKIAHSHAEQSRKASNGTLAPASAWTYDFTQASVACVTIYLYCAGMSAMVWGMMKWKAIPVSLVDTLALYGYSMTTFLVAAILCCVPNHTFQWFIVIGCGLWSSAFLLLNFWHVWKYGLETSWFFGVVIVVLGFHMLITMSFKFYFFNYDF